MSSRSITPSSSLQAEVVLLSSLKSCLVNLPSNLVNVLRGELILVQNVIVELNWRAAADAQLRAAKVNKSIYVGWTGMQAQAVAGRRDRREQEPNVSTVELDAAFAALIGLTDGSKVRSIYPVLFELSLFRHSRSG